MRTYSRDHLSIAALVPVLLVTACEPYAGGGVDVATQRVEPAITGDQTKLLETAFAVASKIPVDPHVKDRSRAQYEVVSACLKLDQPKLALERGEKINDWRRGLAFADVAFHFASKHDVEAANLHAKRAESTATSAADWRRDRIRARIAQTYALLGDEQNAKSFETGFEGTEAGKTHQARAMIAQEQDFDRQVSALDALVASGNFDAMRNAVGSFVELFKRFYADEARRAIVERKIEAALSTFPAAIRIEVLLKLASFAIEQRDSAKALSIVNQARAVIDGHNWLPEAELAARAHVAGTRWLAGEQDNARTELDVVQAMYESQREKIVDIERAEPLRAIAETLMIMGDAPAAMETYRKSVEEGVVNPNSRPRALDLTSTCVSMALHRMEPDDEFWNRLDQIIAELGHPW